MKKRDQNPEEFRKIVIDRFNKNKEKMSLSKNKRDIHEIMYHSKKKCGIELSINDIPRYLNDILYSEKLISKKINKNQINKINKIQLKGITYEI